MKRVIQSILVIVGLLALFLILAQSAEGDVYTINEDHWLYFELEDYTTDNSFEYDFESGNQYHIDVYMLDDFNYELYKNDENFQYYGSGSFPDDWSGYVNWSIPENDTYYLVFDNTDRGDAQPPWDGEDNEATVEIETTTWTYRPGGGSSGSPSTPQRPSDVEEDKEYKILGLEPMMFLILVIIIVVIFASIAVVGVQASEKSKKNKELDKRKQYVQGYSQGQRRQPREERYRDDRPRRRENSRERRSDRGRDYERESYYRDESPRRDRYDDYPRERDYDRPPHRDREDHRDSYNRDD